MTLWGQAAAGWWILTGVLVAIELATGTFYLLMLAIGTLAAALGTHLGLPWVAQLLLAAVIGGCAVAALHWRRRGAPRPIPAGSNPDVNLDIGSRVQVAHWNLDGSARVQYRGASWQVRHVGSGMPIPGEYVVRAVEGQTLLLDR